MTKPSRKKGAPTPPAPQNARQPSSLEVGPDDISGIPAPQTIAFVIGMNVTLSAHPTFDGPICDLSWLLPNGGVIATRFPATSWEQIRSEVDKVVAQVADLPTSPAPGLHVAGAGTDLAAEAAAAAKLKGDTNG